jgi:predicted MFS family arabinose efflux permease
MSKEPTPSEKTSPRKLLVPSIVAALFAVSLSTPMLRLFTRDFATTFQVPTAIAGQASTVNGAAEVVFAFLMGFFAVKFKHRSILLVGVLLTAVSAIGSYLAPNFSLMLIFYSIEGVASVMVGIIGLTLVGDALPFAKKAKAVSYMIAVSYLAFLVGLPVVGFIAAVWGWRSVFILLVLPVSVAGLVLAFFALPSRPHEQQISADEKPYVGSFKQVLLNKSAVSCLLVGMFASAASVGVYTIPFFMEQFSMSLDLAVVTLLLATSMWIIASLVIGRLVNRIGAKPITIACSLASSVFVMAIFAMPSMWLALAVDMVHVWFAAAAATAFSCLVLDQVPKSRGTMMSTRSIFGAMGGAIGAAVGGVALFLFSYQALGLAIGAIGIIPAAIVFFLVKDPNKPKT